MVDGVVEGAGTSETGTAAATLGSLSSAPRVPLHADGGINDEGDVHSSLRRFLPCRRVMGVHVEDDTRACRICAMMESATVMVAVAISTAGPRRSAAWPSAGASSWPSDAVPSRACDRQKDDSGRHCAAACAADASIARAVLAGDGVDALLHRSALVAQRVEAEVDPAQLAPVLSRRATKRGRDLHNCLAIQNLTFGRWPRHFVGRTLLWQQRAGSCPQFSYLQ